MLLVLLLALPAVATEGGLTFTVAPETVAIDSLFDGATLTVSGTAPADCDLIVRVMGASGDLYMKQKGRALGLLWMNLGSLNFAGVPSVYLVTATRPLDQLGAAAQPFTLEGIEDKFQVTPPAADTPETRAEFVKLKVSEGFYREAPPGVTTGPAETGSRPFQARIQLPSRLVPGIYTVEAAALRDGRVVGLEQRQMAAHLIGVPALLAGMAFGNAVLYGVLAVAIAILAGLVIGLVFQAKGAH
jgi:uncharacterized protein (TIGR02186 family)